ncbi:MAG TPA: cytochrome c3 family protein, partial [Geobacteraceae bacterium]
MKNRIALSVAILSLALLALAEIAPAANIVPDPPHDKSGGILCITCHANHQDLGGTGYNNICLNCHRPGFPKGGAKPLTEADIANPFRTFTSARLGTVFQTSHGWATPDTLPAAGAQPPVQAAMTTNTLRARTAGQLACVRCHNQHSNVNGKFLRVANDQDQLCLDCHRSRNTPSHIQGTHPVGVDYAASAAANPGLFTRLSSNSPVILKGGKVLCSSCHGVHYTDSRAATPSAANFNNLSTSDGLLLRVPLHGATVAAGQPDTGNICVSCHAGKLNHNRIGQNVQCGDCHGG